jgi:hypothetical protein
MRIRPYSISVLALIPCGSGAVAQGTESSSDNSVQSISTILEQRSQLYTTIEERLEAQPSLLRRPELARIVISQSVANGPTDRALSASAVPDIQLVASADKKVASLDFSFRLGSPNGTDLAFTQASARVATTVDDTDENNILFGLRGFSGGTEVTFRLTHFFAGMPTPARAVNRNERSVLAQAALANADAAIYQASEPCASGPGIAAAVRAETCAGDTRSMSFLRAAERFGQRELDLFVAAAAPKFPFIGVSFTGNQDSFRYLNRASFAIASESHFGYEATIFGGIVMPSTDTALTATYTYTRRFEAQSPVSLCQTINATQEQCLTGPDGPPDRTHGSILSLEWRQGIGAPGGGGAQFAIAPELSYDLESHAYALDVPIYLARDGAGKLRGGIRAGYVNRRDGSGGREGEFSLGVFVGAPFSIFN